MSNLSEQELNQLVGKALIEVRSADEAEGKFVDSAPKLTMAETAHLIEHTLLKPEATEAQIRQLCQEAKHYGFASVCVNPTWVALSKTLLVDSLVKVCSVAGFPMGATLPEAKAFEAERAVQAGAHEIDMVINVGRLKSGDHHVVFQDVVAVVAVARRYGALVKAILETSLLSKEEKVAACVLAQAAGVDFVKTSTGFNGGRATVADISLMRRVVGPTLGVKASGGVRSAYDVQLMVAAGATRIGTSAGVKIMEDFAAGSTNGQTPSGNAIKERY